MSSHDSSEKNKDLYIEPKNITADASVIWLHGLGASSDDFVGIIDQLHLPEDHKIRFVFPQAGNKKITINNGMVMPAWYDIKNLDFVLDEDKDGIVESSKILESYIQKEINKGVKYKRIILAGFSQGGAIALYTGVRSAHSLGGIIALSTYELLSKTTSLEINKDNLDLNIFMAHGLFDPIVPLQIGKSACENFISLGYHVQWCTYPMQHTLVYNQILEIGNFIRKVLKY